MRKNTNHKEYIEDTKTISLLYPLFYRICLQPASGVLYPLSYPIGLQLASGVSTTWLNVNEPTPLLMEMEYSTPFHFELHEKFDLNRCGTCTTDLSVQLSNITLA